MSRSKLAIVKLELASNLWLPSAFGRRVLFVL